MLEYVFLALGIIIIIMALNYFFRKNHTKSKSTSTKSLPKNVLVNCPVCGSPLPKGENLVSRVYRPMTVPDQRCTISGCPHCFPKCEVGVKRKCPVCNKTVPMEGYLIARLFNKTDSKKHVMITGCTECAKHNAP